MSKTIVVRFKSERLKNDKNKARAERWARRAVPEAATESSPTWRVSEQDRFRGYQTKTQIVVEVHGPATKRD